MCGPVLTWAPVTCPAPPPATGQSFTCSKVVFYYTYTYYMYICSAQHTICTSMIPSTCLSLCSPPCDERCPKPLACGHPCPSICGEACPSPQFCPVCAKDDVKDRVVDLISFTTYGPPMPCVCCRTFRGFRPFPDAPRLSPRPNRLPTSPLSSSQAEGVRRECGGAGAPALPAVRALLYALQPRRTRAPERLLHPQRGRASGYGRTHVTSSDFFFSRNIHTHLHLVCTLFLRDTFS